MSRDATDDTVTVILRQNLGDGIGVNVFRQGLVNICYGDETYLIASFHKTLYAGSQSLGNEAMSRLLSTISSVDTRRCVKNVTM